MKKVSLTGGYLTWGASAFPVQSQFAVSASGPWHPNMEVNDKYRRDKIYDGTWGNPFQFKGQDGAAGSDGDPKGYLKSIHITEITKDGVKSPLIQGARIEGAEIWGGKISSGSTIDVKTDAKIGHTLILRGDDFSNGVRFCHDDGTVIAEIDVDPVTESMFLSTPRGKVVINGHEYSPYFVFA